MDEAVFFRLLANDVDNKPVALQEQLKALNEGRTLQEVFCVSNSALGLISGSPFGYWINNSIRSIFSSFPTVEADGRDVRIGDHPGNKDRYVRHHWEIREFKRSENRYWLPYLKGGSYSPFFGETNLVVDWDSARQTYFDFYGRRGRSNERPSNYEYFLRPSLTWPLRTNEFGTRIAPNGCIYSNKSPGVFAASDSPETLLALLAVMNSQAFETLLMVQVARVTLAKSFETGLIRNTPIPNLDANDKDTLGSLSEVAHDVQRDNHIHDETTHVFGLPGLVECREESLAAANLTLEQQALQRRDEFARVQAEIDEIVFDLYGLDEADRQLVMREMGTSTVSEDEVTEDDESDDNEEETLPENMPERVQNLLMWCVGVAFGRWDVRKALDHNLIPELHGPFDPLPRCAPGALMNPEGLPAEKHDMPDDYPLPIAWDDVLVDDPAKENNSTSLDIVARVRGVLTLLWGDQADAIEQEVCGALEVRDLRDYFRHPTKGFFGFHIKRYSKSRRKAPIYWLLQSEKRNCGVWLYYPRMDQNTLFTAENLIYEKLRREQYRVTELKEGLEALSGSARKQREREIDKQAQLTEEISAFLKTLRNLANLKLPPDHNDGVLISIAPLYELVPWKEAGTMWRKLERGEYTWSSMSQEMQRRGLICAKEE